MSSTHNSKNIFSVNVGSCSSAHQIALQNAFTNQIDILLIQEPYISRNIDRRITFKHSAFECFTPVDDWSIRPRVLTHSKKNNSLTYSQERPDSGSELGLGDILFLSVEFPPYPRLLVVNVYNALPGATNPGAGVSRLITLADAQFPSKTILAGDLNLHHPLWHPLYSGSPSTQSESFIRWLESRELSLISEIDKPTHIRGNVLDLCFGSNQIVAAGTLATTQGELDVTSDHTL